MNKAKLKTYAPQARKDFIAAVTARAHRLGLSEHNGQLQIAAAEKAGDVVIIAGQSWPAKISRQRDNLIALMHKHGFTQTVENVAYTWFNRFAALRYMEIHDYLNHGYRVLSSREGGLPEILGHAPELAQNGDLPGLNPQRAIELKLAGDQDGELYRLTLIAQCNALSNAMPFLFEKIDDETELLLPDNLLLTDSVIAKLVDSIPEEDWSQVEIIGWLYQFYISEKKDQVIGKVVKSEDIPAATQLFTPNWIVQYLVQNSIGRLWLEANPASALKSDWPYYIEPAEQTPEVQAQLDALIQARMAEDGGSLSPETITVLDPACGSGHILVEAYEVLKAIYQERGYQARSIPRLILEKNLYGLDIDDRAAQLAGFALLMKARADDRRLLDNPPKLNVMALQESKGLDADELTQALSGYATLTRPTIASLLETFIHAKTFGSLIQIPQELNGQLPAMDEALQQAIQSGDLFTQAAAFDLLPLVQQATILGMQFDAVVANPPYMGGRNMNDLIKSFIQRMYSESRADIYAAFIERGLLQTKKSGFEAMVTMETWMFLSSYEQMRQSTLAAATLISLIHMPYEGKGRTSMGINFGVSAFCAQVGEAKGYLAEFQCIRHTEIDEDGVPVIFPVKNDRHTCVSQDDLQKIPGSPIAYWVSPAVRNVFTQSRTMGNISKPRQGLATGDNDRFVRFWHEVDFTRIGIGFNNGAAAKESRKKWFPHQKGGDFRKWFGNEECVVDWEDDGRVLRNFKDANGKLRSRPQSIDCYFQECLSWSDVTSASNSFRWHDQGFIPNVIAPVVFEEKVDLRIILLASNNSFFNHVIKALNPTLHFHVGYFSKLPYPEKLESCDLGIADELIRIARTDWNSNETSWNFSTLPWIGTVIREKGIELAWKSWSDWKGAQIARMIELETKNNEFFIDAYDLGKELNATVAREDITLADADREKDCQRLVSYALGCMMGRYSLDEPGLIYAHAGNVGFDPDHYNTFPADADGIVPITDELWFEDDAAGRISEFLLAVWGTETLDENLAWLAESLGQKASETPEETIRRYLASSFFKDHLQTYKKRPIYWLFSSGKQGAFQALVYLHRYHEGTLARMRAEYVVPLTGKIQSRIEMLKKDADSAASNAARNKLNKDIEKLNKKHVELLAYDEKLRHYADLRIQLDLDDGVKANYGKFGDLLAEVKAVRGGTGDD